jgi:hypothetical protein
MTGSKQIQGEHFTIGTISVLRTLVELDRAGVIDLSLDDTVAHQPDHCDAVAGAVEAIRESIVHKHKK